mmetsp:Transcript_57351/g.139911  ORF Transcript_57351/g.139911 Transcript_57351/m.139911 type:complete len:454 (+) Transcript_57351:45-1406(+)
MLNYSPNDRFDSDFHRHWNRMRVVGGTTSGDVDIISTPTNSTSTSRYSRDDSITFPDIVMQGSEEEEENLLDHPLHGYLWSSSTSSGSLQYHRSHHRSSIEILADDLARSSPPPFNPDILHRQNDQQYQQLGEDQSSIVQIATENGDHHSPDSIESRSNSFTRQKSSSSSRAPPASQSPPPRLVPRHDNDESQEEDSTSCYYDTVIPSFSTVASPLAADTGVAVRNPSPTPQQSKGFPPIKEDNMNSSEYDNNIPFADATPIPIDDDPRYPPATLSSSTTATAACYDMNGNVSPTTTPSFPVVRLDRDDEAFSACPSGRRFPPNIEIVSFDGGPETTAEHHEASWDGYTGSTYHDHHRSPRQTSTLRCFIRQARSATHVSCWKLQPHIKKTVKSIKRTTRSISEEVRDEVLGAGHDVERVARSGFVHGQKNFRRAKAAVQSLVRERNDNEQTL